MRALGRAHNASADVVEGNIPLWETGIQGRGEDALPAAFRRTGRRYQGPVRRLLRQPVVGVRSIWRVKPNLVKGGL